MEVKQLKGLAEAYQEVYYSIDNFVSDLSEICLENFFETYEDSDYFVQQLIEQDLLDEFLLDLAEKLDTNISSFLQEGYLNEAGGAALRSIINALSSAGRAKAGLSATSALGKSGNIIKGSAASTAIRSARKATKAAQPATQAPGKYLKMLADKRAKSLPPDARQGLLFTAKGKPQNFTGGRTPFIGSEPIKQGPRSPLPKPTEKISSSPGQLEIDFSNTSRSAISKPQGTPGTSGKPYKWTSSRDTSPFRQVGPNNPQQTLRSGSSSRFSVKDKSDDSVKKALTLGALAAGSAALTAASTNKGKHDPTNHYNTMDPDGRIRDRLAVGPKIVGPKIVGPKKIGSTFDDAFREARKQNKKTFKYGSKEFTTDVASESYNNFEILADKLVTEGYVKNYDGAVSMINSLDDSGLMTLAQRIFEA